MTTSPQPSRFIIVGAGLGGALMAALLAKDGHHVAIYERRPDPRAKGFIGGRSINLALSARGISGLARAGLAERVLADAIPMRGRMLHSPAPSLAFQHYSSDPTDAINSVSRGGLNLTLLESAAALPNVQLFFDHRCADIDFEATSATFVNNTTSETIHASADAIIGADGAFSAVRGKMQIQDRFNYSQSYLEHGYKELHIPPTAAGEFAMEPNALHIWPRGGSMMIALPNPDKSFTCTLFWPYRGEHSFDAVRTREDVLPFFQRHYPDAPALMPTLVDDFMTNPTSSLVTVRCHPWRINRVALLGDAAHAIVPFYGQGMNAAFEDCIALLDAVRARPRDLAGAFEAYQNERKEHADAIADMALDNFVEMRDKVASPAFRMKKRVEHALHRWIPRHFTPLYNLISFSLVPYAEARRRARRQWRAVLIGAGVVSAIVLLLLIALIAALAD